MLRQKGQNVKDLFESLGPAEFVGKVAEILEAKPEDGGLKPEDFSIRELHEAVDPSTFPTVTGLLISKKVMDAYQGAPTVGGSLTTLFPSSLEIDRVTGMAHKGAIEEVKAGMPYGHTGDLEEKWVQIGGAKYGKILDITEEAIMFDQTGKLLMYAGQIGDKAAFFKEKKILYTIQDQTSYRAYYPSGTVSDLYSSGHKNLVTNILADHTDIDAALVKLGAMKDENDDPIAVQARQLLVPVALQMTAARVAKSPVIVGAANQEPNPFAGMFAPLVSSYLDAVSAVQWYIGDFPRQFVWKEVIPIQVLQRTSKDNEYAWERDIVTSYKVRFYGEAAALDYRYVCKSSGTA